MAVHHRMRRRFAVLEVIERKPVRGERCEIGREDCRVGAKALRQLWIGGIGEIERLAP